MVSSRIFIFTLVNVSTVLFNLTHGLLLIVFGSGREATGAGGACATTDSCPPGVRTLPVFFLFSYRSAGCPGEKDRGSMKGLGFMSTWLG